MNIGKQLQELKERGNFRYIPDQAPDNLTDLSSNDYLGLGTDQSLRMRFLETAECLNTPFTSSASRLLAGQQSEYHALEHLLSVLYHRPVLLMNSGYHANTGTIPALSDGARTLIVADRLVHASIIDGIILSRAPFERFRHNDTKHLASILDKHARDYERVIIVTESVFSMDGDKAPLERIAELRREYPNSLLYVDEAHAFGVEGSQGLGLAQDIPDADVIIGTFGKACASVGAFVAVRNNDLRDLMVNRARSFIFSTALPPINCAWTKFVIERMVNMDTERDHLRSLAAQLHEILSPMSVTPIEPSHIQPLVTGDARKAVELSSRLRDEGFQVLPIRTPTVPAGTERLRFSLSAALSSTDISRLESVLTSLI